MSKLNISRLTNENEDGAPSVSGIATFSSTAFLVPPSGTTAQRPEYVQPGMIRFNTDGAHLEYYNGVEWTEVLVANNTLDGGNRGLFGGGYAPSPATTYNVIDYVTISSLGNAIDFGDRTEAKQTSGACASSIRGVWGGGYSITNTIDYVTISSTGNALDFGDLTQGRYHLKAFSSQTRGIFGLGFILSPAGTNVNTMDYITIASTGNAVDFGDASQSRHDPGSCASSTRGIFAGGRNPTNVNTIDYVTISSIGNAIDFGDLTTITSGCTGCSNSTRGVFGGGNNPLTSNTNTIEFITIATTGNAQDFGDLTLGRNVPTACSSSTRGIFGGGAGPLNVIDYVTILTVGNALDFGDLTVARQSTAACSNGHGGL
jgi:hypothetical protein